MRRGVAGTVATSFDGYPMARKGQAGKALTIAAVASFAGGTIGAILLMIFAPALSSVALLFHSAEYFALMVVGLSAIAAFAGTGQVAKALMMTILGLILATVGEGALFNMAAFHDGANGSSIGHQLYHAGHGNVRPARSDVPGPEPRARGKWRRIGQQDHRPALQPGRGQIHGARDRSPIGAGLLHRRVAGGRCHNRVLPGLCGGTQHCPKRRTGAVR